MSVKKTQKGVFMNSFKDENSLILETLIGIFSVNKGKIKILLMRKKDDPYKGHWILPGSILNVNETLEDNVNSVINVKLGLPSMYIEQCYTLSEFNRNQDARILATSYIGLIDNITLVLKKQDREGIELEWFDINSIPKTAYDHDQIIAKLVEYLRKRITNSNILRILFPSDFTLPELQKVYEQILNIKIDRRNFRKKLLNLDYVVYTGDVNEGYMGRPAKLYRFNEELKERNIF